MVSQNGAELGKPRRLRGRPRRDCETVKMRIFLKKPSYELLKQQKKCAGQSLNTLINIAIESFLNRPRRVENE
jgi:hypothetical protein